MMMEPSAQRVERQTPEAHPGPEKMLEPNAKRIERQTPEAHPEPEKMVEQKKVSKPRNGTRKLEMMMEPNAQNRKRNPGTPSGSKR